MSMIVDKHYTDIHPEMLMAWDKDMSKATGIRAVKNSILGIITTRKGSRPFDPDFGCDMHNSLFENMSPLVADALKTTIISAIKYYEPRVRYLNVEVLPIYDKNEIIVTVKFSIIDNPDIIEQLRVQLS